ncbi:MAG: Unknown protein [uncultured Sulfurovum sp.]|uniref:Card1 endonuclease domain-containing protein n=1 Tax=uncultured Sulfurovum sp. TaxID=269237 RepID=A0A6S6TGZ4_9BACT|nr:MAG: Unknown protein [uncultured Sulfurovum sp.]
MELLTIVHANKIELIPIIYEFMGKVTRHILFYDQASEEKFYAFELKKSIEMLSTKHGFFPKIEMIEIDEDSKKDMERIAKAFEGDREALYLNGAGADTALFTVLSSIVLRNHGKVIAYDKEDNSYNLVTQQGFTNEKINKNMNLTDFLILMGDALLESLSTEKIVADREALLELFSDAKRMFKIRFMLKKRETKALRKNYPKVMEALRKLEIVNQDYVMNGQEGFVRFGFLFESFVYLQVKKFDFDDIKVGAKIRFDEHQVNTKNIQVVNEFDILTIKNNKIGFIECKIGDSHDPLGTIYKSDSIMDYFGETASSLILNVERDKTPHLKQSKRNFGASLIYRAKTKKVAIYNSFDFSRNAFRSKIEQAFSVALKEEYFREENKKSIQALSNKWGN